MTLTSRGGPDYGPGPFGVSGGAYPAGVTTPVSGPPRPAASPVDLVRATRSDRAVLSNLGQLYRHDLSEGMGLLPNADGTFNNRRLDAFFVADDPSARGWLIRVAGQTAGFVLTHADDAGGHTGGQVLGDFFVVRALRRTGVGMTAAVAVMRARPGRWTVGFQDYNRGARAFWTRVATAVAGENWSLEHRPVPGKPELPPDSWLTIVDVSAGDLSGTGPATAPSAGDTSR